MSVPLKLQRTKTIISVIRSVLTHLGIIPDAIIKQAPIKTPPYCFF